MDWKYKHFNHQAVFKAERESVLAAAREVVGESIGGPVDTGDGFAAQGYGAWHAAIVTVHVTPVPEGTRVAVELLVERAAGRGYMLVDIGGFYNGQIDKWFAGIADRLGSEGEKVLLSKTTSSSRVARGCLAGCLVYLVVGVCLVLIAIPLDRAVFHPSSGSMNGPFTMLASGIGVLAGMGVFLYVMYPDAPASRSIREWLRGGRKGDGW